MENYKKDPMQMYRGAKPAKIIKETTRSKHAETDLQTKICKWLRNTYPGILFISDFAAGLLLSPFLAGIRSNQSCDDKMLDLIILRPSRIDKIYNYHGLCLEIKTGPDKVFMSDGITLLKNEHTLAQYVTIKKLRSLGYAACFACGEDQIKYLITNYMNDKFVHPIVIERLFTPPKSKADEF